MYKLTMHNLHIEDSYNASKREMMLVLGQIKDCDRTPTIVFDRSLDSLVNEWCVHNFLYNIGYKRERTKDVDLDYPCDRPEWVYNLLGTIVKPFIK